MRKLAPAKINIFLKIVGKRGDYHELISRFVRFDGLNDEIIFSKKTKDCEFELSGKFDCLDEQNTVFKAYLALKKAGFENELKEFFKTNRVEVKKNIPTCAGLGGGSSDAASFMLLCNEVLNLKIDKNQLAKIGEKVGADVPFFIYEFKSANVNGIGEIVKEFEDDVPEIELKLLDVKSSTVQTFKEFSKTFKMQDFTSLKEWEKKSSKNLLKTHSPLELNDLYKSAISLHNELKKYLDEGYFMSGSGSSMFRIKNG